MRPCTCRCPFSIHAIAPLLVGTMRTVIVFAFPILHERTSRFCLQRVVFAGCSRPPPHLEIPGRNAIIYAGQRIIQIGSSTHACPGSTILVRIPMPLVKDDLLQRVRAIEVFLHEDAQNMDATAVTALNEPSLITASVSTSTADLAGEDVENARRQKAETDRIASSTRMRLYDTRLMLSLVGITRF